MEGPRWDIEGEMAEDKQNIIVRLEHPQSRWYFISLDEDKSKRVSTNMEQITFSYISLLSPLYIYLGKDYKEGHTWQPASFQRAPGYEGYPLPVCHLGHLKLHLTAQQIVLTK